jgi:hypothetical protein
VDRSDRTPKGMHTVAHRQRAEGGCRTGGKQREGGPAPAGRHRRRRRGLGREHAHSGQEQREDAGPSLLMCTMSDGAGPSNLVGLQT